MRGKLLIAEDDGLYREVLVERLSAEYDIETVTSVADLAAALERRFDVLLVDDQLEDGWATDHLALMSDRLPSARIVLCTAGERPRSAELALRHGVQSFLAKPTDIDTVRLVLARALEASRHAAVIAALERRGSSDELEGIDHDTAVLLKRAANSDVTLLLTGETGVGKTHVAKRVHRWSRRASGPFVHLNCAAIPEALADSELFGAERGSFTGAVSSRMGAFELASGGTLLLDELAELSTSLQAKLLLAIEEKVIRRVGGANARPVDTRVVAATNRNLEAEMAAGRFRADLFYRLQVLPVRVPALREDVRRIAALAAEMLHLVAPDRKLRLARGELELLQAYDWPGNVRELRNVIERASILDDSEELRPSRHLPSRTASTAPRIVADDAVIASLADVERAHIDATLQRLGGNRVATARALGIGVATLRRKLAEQ